MAKIGVKGVTGQESNDPNGQGRNETTRRRIAAEGFKLYAYGLSALCLSARSRTGKENQRKSSPGGISWINIINRKREESHVQCALYSTSHMKQVREAHQEAARRARRPASSFSRWAARGERSRTPRAAWPRGALSGRPSATGSRSRSRPPSRTGSSASRPGSRPAGARRQRGPRAARGARRPRRTAARPARPPHPPQPSPPPRGDVCKQYTVALARARTQLIQRNSILFSVVSG